MGPNLDSTRAPSHSTTARTRAAADRNALCWISREPNLNPMPIDPVDTDARDLRPNLPDFLDENPNRDLIMEGMEVSENERRDAAADVYGEDPSLPVSDDTVIVC